MPRFRKEIAEISPYVPGRSIEEVGLEIGIPPEDIIKLASNESPEGPFPGVVEATTAALLESHRYPDDSARDLTSAVAGYAGVPEDHIWFGNGSVALLGSIALAVGGPGTSAVYGWPSFVMYRIISKWAATEAIEVPLDSDFRFDLEAIRESVREDTTVVYLCNPNNPTGTVVPGDGIAALIEALPGTVLVVVDEAYHEFVGDPEYRSAVPLALDNPNVVVLRTFSKVFGLAGHRIGWAVARPDTLTGLKKAQAPFSVTSIAMAAAAVSVGNADEIRHRVAANAAGRHHLVGVLEERGIAHAHSETNFIFMRLDGTSSDLADRFEQEGVIVRPMSGGWLRVTVGNQRENARFVAALDRLIPSL
jgi:histidinol-phosphate aminotransferase